MLPATSEGVLVHDRPLLTYRDDATGERVELSAEELGRWAARSASLLRVGCGIEAGGRVAVLLPPHWQTAAVLLGAWSIGAAVSFRPWATAGLTPLGPEAGEPYDAVFAARSRIGNWLETAPSGRHRFVLGLAPNGAPTSDVPEGYQDYLTGLGRFPDDAPAYHTIPSTAPASPDGTSYQDWANLARELADIYGLRPGDKLLVDVAEHEEPVKWLLAPMSVGASIVLCSNVDISRAGREEGATRVL